MTRVGSQYSTERSANYRNFNLGAQCTDFRTDCGNDIPDEANSVTGYRWLIQLDDARDVLPWLSSPVITRATPSVASANKVSMARISARGCSLQGISTCSIPSEPLQMAEPQHPRGRLLQERCMRRLRSAPWVVATAFFHSGHRCRPTSTCSMCLGNEHETRCCSSPVPHRRIALP